MWYRTIVTSFRKENLQGSYSTLSWPADKKHRPECVDVQFSFVGSRAQSSYISTSCMCRKVAPVRQALVIYRHQLLLLCNAGWQ